MFLFQGECKGFRDVLKTYTRVTPTVKLHRPTNFAPLIYKAIEIIQNTGKVCIFTRRRTESLYDKTKSPVCPAKIQISLGLVPV